jgi:hypothetical protein
MKEKEKGTRKYQGKLEKKSNRVDGVANYMSDILNRVML